MTAQARRAPSMFVGNYFQDVTLVDAVDVRENIFRASGRYPQTLLRDPSRVVSNLFVAPSLPARHAVILVGGASSHATIEANSFDPGAGAAVRHDPPAAATTEYRDNLSLGPLFGLGSRADAAARVDDNAVVAPAALAEAGSGLAPSVHTNDVLEVRWAERDYLLGDCAPASLGYGQAGVAAPREVPLRPAGGFRARQAGRCDDPDQTPWTASEPDEPVHRKRLGTQCAQSAGARWRWWVRR